MWGWFFPDEPRVARSKTVFGSVAGRALRRLLGGQQLTGGVWPLSLMVPPLLPDQTRKDPQTRSSGTH